MWTNTLSFTALLLLSTSTINAAPISVSSQIEILRINGVNEREIERSFNPTHSLASAHDSTIPRTATPFTAPQQFLLSALSSATSASHYSSSSKDDTPTFEVMIDGYSTAKSSPYDPSPSSAFGEELGSDDHSNTSNNAAHRSSLGAFEKVRRWMMSRGRSSESDDDDMIVTGRLGSLKIRGRR